jgi:hypothetical protein
VKDVLSARIRPQKAAAGETARTGDSQRRIREADTDPLIEDDGSTEFKPAKDEKRFSHRSYSSRARKV